MIHTEECMDVCGGFNDIGILLHVATHRIKATRLDMRLELHTQGIQIIRRLRQESVHARQILRHVVLQQCLELLPEKISVR